MAEVEATCVVQGQRYLGIHTVPIRQIRGSEGRCRDFDRDFNPLRSCGMQRWRRIMEAREEGKSLPPVALVQVGEVYFVRDGHHRISVARAFRQEDIEAEVTLWQVSGPLPWEGPVDTPICGLLRRLSLRLAGLSLWARVKVKSPQVSAGRV